MDLLLRHIDVSSDLQGVLKDSMHIEGLRQQDFWNQLFLGILSSSSFFCPDVLV